MHQKRSTLKKWCFGQVLRRRAVCSSCMDHMEARNAAVTRPYRLPPKLNKIGKECFRTYAVLFLSRKDAEL